MVIVVVHNNNRYRWILYDDEMWGVKLYVQSRCQTHSTTPFIWIDILLCKKPPRQPLVSSENSQKVLNSIRKQKLNVRSTKHRLFTSDNDIWHTWYCISSLLHAVVMLICSNTYVYMLLHIKLCFAILSRILWCVTFMSIILRLF